MSMKVLFVIPRQFNVYGGETTKPRLPHIGIAYLSAYLKREGHEVDVYDCTVEENSDSVLFDILTDYDIVGVSLYSLKVGFSYGLINKIAAFLKKYSGKKIPIVLGGPHVTVIGKDALLRTDADFAVKGEGEMTLSELLKNWGHDDRFGQIAGLVWRDALGAIVENSSRGFIEDIDILPFPDYSVFKLDRYMSHELNELPINTSRGCPFDCIFCVAHLVAGKRFRARSPESVVQEMMINYKNGTRNFYIVDDAFNLNVKRAEEICDLIIKSGLEIKFVFQNGLRVDYLTTPLVNRLKEAGCTAIVLSAESGNDDVLKAIKKGVTIEEIIRAVDIVDGAGIVFIVNFIIGHPTETCDKAMDSIRLAREIVKRKNCATVIFFNLIPYPSSGVYDWIERNGKWLFPKENYLDIPMIGSLPIFESNEFTRKDREALLRKGDAIHRRALLKFIFGKFLGSFAQFVARFGFIREMLTRFAFSSKAGQDVAYSRFLRKLYNMR